MPTSPPRSRRFSRPLDAQVATFNASLSFDWRLAPYDIAASQAHAAMLASCNIISKKDAAAIKKGLTAIEKEIATGTFPWDEADEDIHMAIERQLTEKIGDAGKKLHTARSRNDQVATDLRLFLRAEIDTLQQHIKDARLALLEQAEANADTLMPGFTHLQVAQPITFGHHLLAYDEMLARDAERFADCRKRLNKLPLGSGALAGVGYSIDRQQVAKALGFDGLCENSLDAVADRDFAIEYAAAAATLMMHLSRLCEEIIMWCSPAFGFITLSDDFCTGSSIMPQKKNPDVPELMRGKCGRVIGALTSLLVLGKSQPLAYNKDNQEDKEPLFDAVDTANSCTALLAPLLRAMTPQKENMRKMLDAGYPTATELADYLVRERGMAFRDAYHAVGAIVKMAEEMDSGLEELTLEQLQKHAPKADKGALAALSAKGAVERRNHIGGTAPKQVRVQVGKKRKTLKG